MNNLNRYSRAIIFIMFAIFSMAIVTESANSVWWNESFDYRKSINVTNPHSVSLTDFN